MTSSGSPNSSSPNTSRRHVAGERARSRTASPERGTGPRPQGVPTGSAAGPAQRDKVSVDKPPSSGARTSTDIPTNVPSTDVPTASTARARGWRPGWLTAGLAGLLATAALVASVVFWQVAEDRRTLADNEAAARSAAAVIVEKMLGYSYQTFDQHTTEVSALLTGSFKNEFVQAATTRVKPLAVPNQAVVVAKASEVSVMSTTGQGDQEMVRILAFVNQTTTSAKLDRPQIDQNRVILTMLRVGGRWLVSKVEAF